MGAVRHGDYIAKVRTSPLTEGTHDDVDVHAEAEAHRHKLVAEAGERDHRFALQVNCPLTWRRCRWTTHPWNGRKKRLRS
jgi:hypothetical protein